MSRKTIYEGEKVSKPSNPTKKGYTFVEWQLDGKTYNFSDTVNKNITLKAVWKELAKYTITFNSDGGSSVSSQTVYQGEKISKPSNPTKKGYTFVEWQLDGKTYNFSNTVNKNITLKAVWKEIDKYTITFNSNGGSSIPSQTIQEGNKVTKPTDPTKAYHTFNGWTLNGKAYNFNSAVTGNITLTANWKAYEYTITVEKVSEFSTDRYLTVYENRKAIEISKIMYTDGYEVISAINGTKISVSNSDIAGVTTLKVQLKDGTIVTATIK